MTSIPLGDSIPWSMGMFNNSFFLRLDWWISLNRSDRFSTYLFQLRDLSTFWGGKHTSKGNRGFLPNKAKNGETPVTRFLALFNSNKMVFNLTGQEPGLVESSDWRDAPRVRWLRSTQFPWGEYVGVWVVWMSNWRSESWKVLLSRLVPLSKWTTSGVPNFKQNSSIKAFNRVEASKSGMGIAIRCLVNPA